ncbi:hypothetical protein CK203_056011 [Vitis vinifera]|uniref:N-acetyl-D-glucosamine kinase n=1 Tax=Vitis vinifera TaxID=29760 RepID=A0A438GS67_VITVI|nr:hypothetical protein CK203_056011 [Vitis vinifera]
MGIQVDLCQTDPGPALQHLFRKWYLAQKLEIKLANKILVDAVQELALSVKAVVQRLCLCGEDGNGSFPIVMVGGVLEANKRWDIGKEVISCIHKNFPGARPIRPKVSIVHTEF